MVRAIHEELDSARRKLGWSRQRLLDESGLDLTISTFDRKLTGKVALYASDYIAIARALRRGGSAVRFVA